jgi:hypothetical protein
MAESDNILTKLQGLLVYLIPQCFVENFSLTPGFSRVRMVCAEKKTV